MVNDFSCGVIPYRVNDAGAREFLLIQHKGGHWSFPKGHPEKGETELETARRELAEETGLTEATLDESRPFEEFYEFTKRSGKHVRKRVLYYLGEVLGNEPVKVQEEEVSDYAWCGEAQANERLTFDEGRALLTQVLSYVDSPS